MKRLIPCAVLAALAAFAIAKQPVSADEVTTVTTGSSGMVTTVGGTPEVVITNSSVKPMLVETKLTTMPTPFVTTRSVITAFLLTLPDDLITRRDQLLARIVLEQARGKLSADEASSLIGQADSIDARRAGLSKDDCSAYHKEVKRLYRDYDRLANDIKKDSHEGAKQLASTNYFIF
jgi:hypothetical protein